MKMKFRTLICLLLCLCLMAGLLTGCGDDTAETTASTTEPTTETTEPTQSTTENTSYADIVLEDTVWELGDLLYIFYADSTLGILGNNSVSFGSYTWDGQKGTFSTVDEEGSLENRGESGLILISGEGKESQLVFSEHYEEAPSDDQDESQGTDLLGTVWSLDGVVYIFGENGSITLSDGDETAYGSYTWYDDFDFGTISLDGFTVDMAMVDSTLMLVGEDDEVYAMEYMGLSNGEGDDSGDHEGEYYGNWIDTNNGDGTSTFEDYDCNVKFDYPTWMTVIVGGFDFKTDVVIIGDDAGGYVIGDNVTDEWWDYEGTDSDFLMDYIDTYLPDIFTELYGEYTDGDLEELESDAHNRLATYYLNLWDDDALDIQIQVLLYETSSSADGDIMVKMFLAPYFEDDQFQYLWDNVVNMVGIY